MRLSKDSYSPDEVLAVATEGGLLEEPGDKLVVVDDEDVFLLEGALSASLPRGEGSLHVPRPGVVLLILLLLFVRHAPVSGLLSGTSRPHSPLSTDSLFPRLRLLLLPTHSTLPDCHPPAIIFTGFLPYS